MGVFELLERNRKEARERRMAIIADEDAAAAAVKKEEIPAQAIGLSHEPLQQIKTGYSGLKPSKRRKITGKLILPNGCPSIPG